MSWYVFLPFHIAFYPFLFIKHLKMLEPKQQQQHQNMLKLATNTNLCLKNNLTDTPIDYVSILVENIDDYTKALGFEEKSIKYIQTIGKVESLFKSNFFLVSLKKPEEKIYSVYNFAFYNFKPTNRKSLEDLVGTWYFLVLV